MSFGAGVVISAVKAGATEGPRATGSRLRRPEPGGPRREQRVSVAPAFYALEGGGWRDYWTLLHPPYTLWHLSYVLLGAALAPMPDPRIVAGALIAFSLAVGVEAHSFDELQGRPLGTQIPSAVLVALGSLGLTGAVGLGVLAAAMLGPWFLALVVLGALVRRASALRRYCVLRMTGASENIHRVAHVGPRGPHRPIRRDRDVRVVADETSVVVTRDREVGEPSRVGGDTRSRIQTLRGEARRREV